MPDPTALLPVRIPFGFTIAFHLVFPAITSGSRLPRRVPARWTRRSARLVALWTGSIATLALPARLPRAAMGWAGLTRWQALR